MADLPSAYPLRDLFDAAVRGYSIKLTCRYCKRGRILHGHGLWWLFEQRGWPDRLSDVPKRLYCRACQEQRSMKIKGPVLELVHEEITGGPPLPLPPVVEWKRAMSRRR